MQVTMRVPHTGASTNTKIRTTDSVDILHTDMVKFQFSYIDGDGYHFMDPESFNIQLDASVIGDSKDFLVENQSHSILHVDDRPISIELPAQLNASKRIRGRCEGGYS